jgi:hypothetical protein
MLVELLTLLSLSLISAAIPASDEVAQRYTRESSQPCDEASGTA